MKLSLTYPVRNPIITQKFGETAYLQYYRDHGINFKGHNGIDFYASHGQPIFATHDGIATFQEDSSGGMGVVLLSDSVYEYGDKYVYFKTIYWHMVDSSKEPKYKSPVEGHNAITGGLKVKKGDIIGYADSTGLSTGDHLHFGLKPCLPDEPIGTWANILQDNGYMGAIDPMPYFDRHIFNTDMNFGDQSDGVVELQKYLIMHGFMTPIPSGEYGYYGNKTKNAVSNFQWYYKVASPLILYWNKGNFVGSMTRRFLNVN